MPRIFGVDTPNNKPTYISLTYLYGIGRATAIEICFELGLKPQMKASELSEDDVSRITKHIENHPTILVEGAKRRDIQANITRLRDIQSYRGGRHRRGLPVRGQRTRTNARTRKGAKKTVAGKKGVKDMRH
jgi:small subunit ribosomal protein S13